MSDRRGGRVFFLLVLCAALALGGADAQLIAATAARHPVAATQAAPPVARPVAEKPAIKAEPPAQNLAPVDAARPPWEEPAAAKAEESAKKTNIFKLMNLLLI